MRSSAFSRYTCALGGSSSILLRLLIMTTLVVCGRSFRGMNGNIRRMQRFHRTTQRHSRGFATSLPSSSHNNIQAEEEPLRKIAIVGGGLAGLSTAYHLMEQVEKNSNRLDLTILDPAAVGTGGASAVAGGLVHPLSPRGKLVHWGREGLAVSNHLIRQACQAVGDDTGIRLRSEIFRLATNQKQASQLQQTSQENPDFCEWLSPEALVGRGVISEELMASANDDVGSSGDVFGGLRLFNGCQVIHLPSYLKALWVACQSFDNYTKVQWKQESVQEASLESFDTIVWAAGSGLFKSSDSDLVTSWRFVFQSSPPPVQLVRGQSIEVEVSKNDHDYPALLSGKYISPMPDQDKLLVGATHEWSSEPMTQAEVKALLQEKTRVFCPHVWSEGSVIEQYTAGVRVQSQRRSRGRLPMVGKLGDGPDGQRQWLFTGLSSRGLLYHGIYGKLLAQAVWEDSEDCLESQCFEYDWWR